MVRAVEAIISIAILMHGYFYVRYGTADPCAAATIRSLQDSLAGASQIKEPVGDRSNAKVLFVCYVVALAGTTVLRDQ
jgi:hypothetical protein